MGAGLVQAHIHMLVRVACVVLSFAVNNFCGRAHCAALDTAATVEQCAS